MKTSTTSKIIGLDKYRISSQNSKEALDIANLSIKLQQTIELRSLLQVFCSETAEIIPCDSVSYAQAYSDFTFLLGEKQKHHCSYELKLEEESLGEVEFTRKKPFTINETNQIENILSLFIYPLRNSLLYKKAIAESYRDPLTKIGNRGAFDETLEREISAFKRHLSNFSLLMIDIDHFKKINDQHGHIVGDAVLKSIANTLKNTIRRSDKVFRYGGEEFVIILSNTHQAGARLIAERLRNELKAVNNYSGKTLKITASLGLSSSDTHEDINNILYQADKALYEAKAQGRDRVVTHLVKNS